jgi:hypothetical protein
MPKDRAPFWEWGLAITAPNAVLVFRSSPVGDNQQVSVLQDFVVAVAEPLSATRCASSRLTDRGLYF